MSDDSSPTVVTFSPAEKRVMIEQCDALIVNFTNMRSQIEKGDYATIWNDWRVIGLHLSYFVETLNYKRDLTVANHAKGDE